MSYKAARGRLFRNSPVKKVTFEDAYSYPHSTKDCSLRCLSAHRDSWLGGEAFSCIKIREFVNESVHEHSPVNFTPEMRAG